MAANLEYMSFAEINLQDTFFDSLKSDYKGFEEWYKRKQDQGEKAYVNYREGKLDGFLYFKNDGDCVNDVEPALKDTKILKIGTFKINPHKTRLGERFIKIVLDHAILEEYGLCYVTIFDKHPALIKLFERYGFVKEGIKSTESGVEGVYVKRISENISNICKRYPMIQTEGVRKYLLSIYPKYHTVMFPDSKLRTERDLVLQDISPTNSIHKVYVCNMEVEKMKMGDIVVIYRTASEAYAEYSSVVTSICVVEEIKRQNEFENFEEFYKYASKYSIFDKDDLFYWYGKGRCRTVKMLYNVALPKRIVRHDLIETVGLDRNEYWGFFEVTDEQFDKILEMGQVNEKFIMN